jgi:allantoin racemase
MRILLVNANTSELVTAKVLAGARAAAAADAEVAAVTGTFGAQVIGTRSEQAIAEHSTIALVSRHAQGFDAVVIAVSHDTGLRAARELLEIPVVGMTEAGLLTACMLGGRIGMIVFGRRVLPMYQEVVASYGLAERIAGWRVLESTVPYSQVSHPELDAAIVAETNVLVEQAGAESVLVTGAVMAGVPARLQHAVPVPLVDCIACGVRQAHLLATLRFPTPRAGSYAAPADRSLSGVDAAILARFRRDPADS